MSDGVGSDKALATLRSQGLLLVLMGVIDIGNAVLQKRTGHSGATWIALGAVFPAPGAALSGRARKAAEASKVAPPKG